MSRDQTRDAVMRLLVEHGFWQDLGTVRCSRFASAVADSLADGLEAHHQPEPATDCDGCGHAYHPPGYCSVDCFCAVDPEAAPGPSSGQEGDGSGSPVVHPEPGDRPVDPELERLCVIMHDAYEDAAHANGWESQVGAIPWVEVPEANKATMRVAVAAAVAAVRADPAPRDLLVQGLELAAESLRTRLAAANERVDLLSRSMDHYAALDEFLNEMVDRLPEVSEDQQVQEDAETMAEVLTWIDALKEREVALSALCDRGFERYTRYDRETHTETVYVPAAAVLALLRGES